MAMHTRFVMVLPGIEDDEGAALARFAETIVAGWEHCLSYYLPDSELSMINESAFRTKQKVSQQMGDVLTQCSKYNHLTNGMYDPSLSPIYKLLLKDKGDISDELNLIKENCGWEHLVWDDENQTVSFLNQYVKLDFGGIGKGFALRDVVDFLKLKGIKTAFLSFGESSVAGVGKHPLGNAWPLVVPGMTEHSNVKSFMLNDEYVSVSGLQKHGADSEDGDFAHIYHPFQKNLVRTRKKVAVKCECPIKAEVLSTSGYMCTETEMQQLKNNFDSVEWHVMN